MPEYRALVTDKARPSGQGLDGLRCISKDGSPQGIRGTHFWCE